jgi:hypothetical protein
MWEKLILTWIIFIILLLPTIVIVRINLHYWNETITTEKIIDVNMELDNNSKSVSRTKYLFTDNNTYSIEDRLFKWHLNSMDTYRVLKMNIWKECKLTTIWNRVWLFSSYKNVIKVNCN